MAEWAARADALHATLADRFWSPTLRLHKLVPGRPLWPCGSWNYWWQAHALGAVLDRAERTGDPADRRRTEVVLGGIRRRGLGRLTNGFYDDMGWLALELLRMQPDRRSDLERLVAELRTGDSERCGGGVSWAKAHRDFVNVPATGTAALVALRWGALRPDPELLGWGLRLLGWLQQTLVEADGVVWDGVHARADGSCELERAEYTYTYGLVVGAGLAAWHATGDRSHLQLARRVATAALARCTDPTDGLWRGEGDGDGALFRGIMARHLADLALESRDAELAATIATQGEAVWSGRGRSDLVGPDWGATTTAAVDLSAHLTGILLVEQCARLQQGGLLPRP